MLDNVRVESYGSTTTLASVAQASMKGPQLIVLTVYDPGVRTHQSTEVLSADIWVSELFCVCVWCIRTYLLLSCMYRFGLYHPV